MYSRIPLISLLLLINFNLAKAQDNNSNDGGRYQRARNTSNGSGEPTGYVSVNEGISSVTGNWGFGVSYQYDGSYAQSGSFQNITAGIPINNSNFGIALMLGFYDNPFDANTFAQNAVAYQNPNADAYGISYYGDYQSVNVMAGVFYTYPLGRFSFDLRGMLGYMSLRLPEVQYSAIQNATPYNIEDDYDISESSAHALAYDIGAGVRYSFRRYYCVLLNFDYLAANMAFSTVVNQTHYDQNNNISGGYYTASGTVPLSLFNISLGLGFQFGGR